MIQLTYQPAFDPFHTVFRFFRLREALLAEFEIPRDHFRILDFYLLFPFRVGDMRLAPKHKRFRKIAEEFVATRPYGNVPDDRTVFGRMKPIQAAAFDTLVGQNYLAEEKFRLGMVASTSVALPDDLRERVIKANLAEKNLVNFLAVLARDYELLGDNGLKARSGLMDYRYDAA